MPRLEIKKKLSASSERVKSVDIHPTESWALAALYSGNVLIWDYETGTCVKSFELSDLPVRCAKFIARKQWFVAASDDMHIRVFNYNTMEKIKDFEAHADYIRFLEVHPTLPYVASSSDDMSIKLWDWDREFDCTQYFEGHSHYVMMVKFNPKDPNTFASASLDRSIKVWGLGSPLPHYTLDGHEKGVNCIDYYPSGDKPYILSGADDHTVKIWDYQTKSVVHTLEGHSHNVCSVLFHPKLPIIASASEDGTVRLWQSSTYRAETTLNYGLERAWALAATKEANKLAMGFDEGCVVIELGSDDPVASMDSTGKIVWALNNEISTGTVKGLASTGGGPDGSDEMPDGDRLPILPRDLGSCELYPQLLKHNCNGRFIVVCGDGEFIIYTAQSLRNKGFGQALDFVWSGSGTGDYAIRESITRVKMFSNFKESKTIAPAVPSAEGLFGGYLMGVKGSEAILFYDWDSGEFIQKIDVCPKEVYWSDSGNMVLLACEDSAYVLTHDVNATSNAIAMGTNSAEAGVEGSFDLSYEINDTITSGKWVGDCFIYCNSVGRLNYSVNGNIQTLVHLDTTSSGATKHRILGYLAKENRVYLIDKSLNVVSFKIMLAVLQYQTAVTRGDFDAANELLTAIPESEYTTVAKFLESQGFKEEAMAVTTDPEHKFDLSIELNQVDAAHALLLETPSEEMESTETMSKWKRLSDAALQSNDFELTEAASIASEDYSGLLLLYSAIGNLEGMEKLAKMAESGGKTNVAFTCYFLTGNVEACVDLLIATNRLPEAAFFARTYLPSRISEITNLWKDDLAKVSESASNALADPVQNPDLFPDMDIALQVEKMFLAQRASTEPTGVDAKEYMVAKDDLELNLIDLIKSRNAPESPPAEEKVPEEEMAALQIDPDEAVKKLAEEEAAAAAAQAELAAAEAELAAQQVEEVEVVTEVADVEAEAEPEPEVADVEAKDGDDEFDWD